MFLNTKSRTSGVSVEESSVARKRVWTYERPPGGTSAATRPLHAHRREAMEQIARGAAAVRRRRAAIGRRGEAAASVAASMPSCSLIRATCSTSVSAAAGFSLAVVEFSSGMAERRSSAGFSSSFSSGISVSSSGAPGVPAGSAARAAARAACPARPPVRSPRPRARLWCAASARTWARSPRRWTACGR